MSGPGLGELVPFFAPTVGRERAEELLRAAAKELGFDEARVDGAAQQAILAHLGKQPGIIGVAARFAVKRRPREAAPAPAPPPSSPRVEAEADAVKMSELVALLSNAMDPAEAQRAVVQRWSASGLRGVSCSRAQAVALLESMAEGTGIVAVAARFAKARLYLRR